MPGMRKGKGGVMKAYYPSDVGNNFWRDIPGFNGKYQASRAGDIRRKFRSGKVRDMTPYKRKGAKAEKISRDRLYVKLSLDGKSKDVQILKIMVDTWKGKVPDGCVPYHINRIVSDNRDVNIGFITRRELGKLTGGTTSKRKSVFKVDRDGNEVEVYRSAREAAKHNNMSYQTVLDRCNGKVKNEYALDGYTYRFEESHGRPRKEEKVWEQQEKSLRISLKGTE